MTIENIYFEKLTIVIKGTMIYYSNCHFKWVFINKTHLLNFLIISIYLYQCARLGSG